MRVIDDAKLVRRSSQNLLDKRWAAQNSELLCTFTNEVALCTGASRGKVMNDAKNATRNFASIILVYDPNSFIKKEELTRFYEGAVPGYLHFEKRSGKTYYSQISIALNAVLVSGKRYLGRVRFLNVYEWNQMDQYGSSRD